MGGISHQKYAWFIFASPVLFCYAPHCFHSSANSSRKPSRWNNLGTPELLATGKYIKYQQHQKPATTGTTPLTSYNIFE